MSIEIHVLFAGQLPSTAELTRRFADLGFPLAFQPGKETLEQHTGYLPMLLRGKGSGVEFDTWEDRNDIEDIVGDLEVPLGITRTANFRFGGRQDESIIAQCFAAALAGLVGGTVLDSEEGCLQTVEEATTEARRLLAGDA